MPTGRSPIFVGRLILSSSIFSGTYYLYGIGALLKSLCGDVESEGMDTGVYGAVAAFGASFYLPAIIEGSLVGIPGYRRANSDRRVGLGVSGVTAGSRLSSVANFASLR